MTRGSPAFVRAGAAVCVAATAAATALLGPAPARGDGVETGGDVLQFALPMSAFGMALGLDDLQGGSQFSKALTATMASTFALKYAIDAERPSGGGQSFPSGHTAAAFSGAAQIARRYGWRLGVPAYGAASFVAFSRVDADRHHERDVIAAAILAIAINYAVAQPLSTGLEVTPRLGDGTFGLSFSGRW